MSVATFALANEDETRRLAAALAACTPRSATIVLSGTLGVGKTRFVQAFAEASGVPPNTVTSPTFVLCQHYEGQRLIHHVDVYRLQTLDEFVEFGGLELFEQDATCFIEWGERLRGLLPAERLEIALAIVGDESRWVTVTAHGSRMRETLDVLRATWNQPAAN